jgi:hypothetical protein
MIRVLWAAISCAVFGVLGFQGVVGSGGDGVRGLISSFDSTTSAFRGTKPVALKPALMLLDEKTLWCTARNAARNASLSMLLMWLFARAPISWLVGWLVGIDFRS